MKNPEIKNIFAIETSCDETAAAVLTVTVKKNWPILKTLSSVVKSQIALHKKFGGVVPEVAARAHVKNIVPVVEKSLHDSGLHLKQINLIAVTAGPGLIPSLLVGVEFAKTLGLAAGIPVLPVNHMLGHLYSPFARGQGRNKKTKAAPQAVFPIISLIVSGGHTMLVVMKNAFEYKVIGQTVDDAAGEAFDKVAKLLGLPYPGGPEISKLAELGNPKAIAFPRPMINSKNYDFSFAGLKTAVLYYLRTVPKTNIPNIQADVCASFQQAAIDVLAAKTFRAAQQYRAQSVSISGGVSANSRLRQEFEAGARSAGLKLFAPPPGLSTDNAEMIGAAAAFMLAKGDKAKSAAKIKADPTLEL